MSLYKMPIKGEECWWALEPHPESEAALRKLSQSFHLPMPSGIKVWDSERRIVALNDDVQSYMMHPSGTPTRSVHSWRQFVCKRGWKWAYYFRSAQNGGSILMFQLPLPRTNAVEKALEPEQTQQEPEVVEEPKTFAPKVIRNRTRKNRAPISQAQIQDEWENDQD